MSNILICLEFYLENNKFGGICLKKTISIIIGIIFTLIQSMLPLTASDITIANRMGIAMIFAIVWIVYSIYADAINEFFCRLFGKSYVINSKKTILQIFNTEIISAATSINKAIKENNLSNSTEYVQQKLYHDWCKIIHFLFMYCTTGKTKSTTTGKTKSTIDYSIVRNEKLNTLWITRDNYIDRKLLNSILKTIFEFDEKYRTSISINTDYEGFKKQLTELSKLFL